MKDHALLIYSCSWLVAILCCMGAILGLDASLDLVRHLLESHILL